MSCCKFHNRLYLDQVDCGMAGMGAVTLCCRNCPSVAWYKENQPTRPITYYEDLSEDERDV